MDPKSRKNYAFKQEIACIFFGYIIIFGYSYLYIFRTQKLFEVNSLKFFFCIYQISSSVCSYTIIVVQLTPKFFFQHTFFKLNQNLLERDSVDGVVGQMEDTHVSNPQALGRESSTSSSRASLQYSQQPHQPSQQQPVTHSNSFSVRGVTIPDLQRSVMNATEPHIDAEQINYQALMRIRDQQPQPGGSYQTPQQQPPHLAQSTRTVRADPHEHLDMQIGATHLPVRSLSSSQLPGISHNNISTNGSVALAVPHQQQSMVQQQQQQRFYNQSYAAANGSYQMQNSLNGSHLQQQNQQNMSNSNVIRYTIPLNDTTLDASTVQIHCLDSSGNSGNNGNTQSMYQASEVVQQRTPLHNSHLPNQGDYSSRVTNPTEYQQTNYSLYNSNPNLSTVTNFSNSLRRALLPDYRHAPDYQSVMSYRQQSGILKGAYPLHCTYSTPDLQSAISLDPHGEFAEEDHRGVPPPPYPINHRSALYHKSNSTSSPDLVTAAHSHLGGSRSHLLPHPQYQHHSKGAVHSKGLSRTYENLCDLDDVVVSLRHHMVDQGNNNHQFLHSFPSLDGLQSAPSLDCLNDRPSVYSLSGGNGAAGKADWQEQQNGATQPEISEPIYQNVVPMSHKPQNPVHFYREQLEKQQQLLEHQELLQKKLSVGSVDSENKLSHAPPKKAERKKWVVAHPEGNAFEQFHQQPSLAPPSNYVSMTTIGGQSQAYDCKGQQLVVVSSVGSVKEPATGHPYQSTGNPLSSSVTVLSVAGESNPGRNVLSHSVNATVNPLSNSVDSTKSSPLMPVSSSDQQVLQFAANLRTTESLGALDAKPCISSNAAIRKNSYIIKKGSDGNENKSVDSNVAGTTGKSKTVSGGNAVLNKDSTEISDAHIKASNGNSSKELNNSTKDNNSTASSSSRPSSTPHDSFQLSRIYAARDPRARQLQNELLSAELPLKFENLALAKANAVYAGVSEREGIWHTTPYLDNRVSLTPTPDNNQGYINASHITASMGSSRQVFYIVHSLALNCPATQVWQCVWEQDVRLLVTMATCLGGSSMEETSSKPSKASRLLSSISKKRGKKKEMLALRETDDQSKDSNTTDEFESGMCFPYWPQQDNTSMECGPYRVFRRDSTVCDGYTISRLLMRTNKNNSRTVWHINYTHGLTNTRSFIEMIEQLQSLRKVSQQEASVEATTPGINVNTPIILQCPAGTEHSGAVLLCDLMIGGACNAASLSREGTLRSTSNLGGGNSSYDAVVIENTFSTMGDGSVMDPVKILPHLRHQRANLVPTVGIFKFIYRVMIEYFGRSRLI